MERSSVIQFIERKDVDLVKWDRCIDMADNGLIYAKSYYLDCMAPNWSALVKGNYEQVMPITWKRKWNIQYITQPFLTAQLGLFGNNINAELLEQFLDKIPGSFRYWDFYLNAGNYFPLSKYDLYARSNYVLDLNESYESLSSRYKESTKRNIRKTWQSDCRLSNSVYVEEVIKLALAQMKDKPAIINENLDRFRKLYNTLQQRGEAQCYGIIDGNNKLLASAVFVFAKQRAYYLLVGNHPDGRTSGASHALIDGFIKSQAGKQVTLDFEGSDIRNLAFFYSSFGAREEKYSAIQLNRLPFYIKWLKR